MDMQEKTTPEKSKEQDAAKKQEADKKARPEPTRYGDWEIGGRCIDF